MISDGEIITSDDFVQIAEIFLLHEEGLLQTCKMQMRASRPMNETKIACKMNKSGSKNKKRR